MIVQVYGADYLIPVGDSLVTTTWRREPANWTWHKYPQKGCQGEPIVPAQGWDRADIP